MRGFVKGLMAVVVVAWLGGVAAASDCPAGYVRVVTYRTVTCVEQVEVPYQRAVTRYDHCGKPYTATVTAYRTVEVTVTRQVPVVRYVPAAY